MAASIKISDWINRHYKSRNQPDSVDAVLVTQICGIGIFYGQVLDDVKIQHDLIQIENGLAEMEMIPVTEKPPKPNKVYAALFVEDDCVYRCMVLDQLPEGKYKIVFIDYGNTAEVDEILELPEPLASVRCHLQKFIMKGLRCVESDDIDTEINRKLFQKLKLRLQGQEVTVITKGNTDSGVTVLFEGSNINQEVKDERKLLFNSLSIQRENEFSQLSKSADFDIFAILESIQDHLTEARVKADKLLQQAEDTLATAEQVIEMFETVQSNPNHSNAEADLDSIEPIFEMITQLDEVLGRSAIGEAQARDARTCLMSCLKEKMDCQKLTTRNSVDRLNRFKVLKAEWQEVKSRQAPLPPFSPEDLVGIDLAQCSKEVAESLKEMLNSLKSERKSFAAKSRDAFRVLMTFYLDKFVSVLAQISTEESSESSSDEDLGIGASPMRKAFGGGSSSLIQDESKLCTRDAFEAMKLTVESEEQMLAMDECLELESFLSLAVTESLSRIEAQLEVDAVAVNRVNKIVERIAED